MGGMGGFHNFHVTWSQEPDGTYSKIKVQWRKGNSYRIEEIEVLESGVSEREYFRRKLANKL
jgi:hypothetical protein